MKLVLEKETNVAVLMFSDDATILLLEDRLESNDLMVTDINSSTHKIVDGAAPESPLYWIARALKFDGGWVISDQDLYDAYLPNAVIIAADNASKEAAYNRHQATEQAKSVRASRDTLLAECDWVAIKAFETATAVSAQWATYRQALRDITAQTGFPWSVEWPTNP